eukprot:TRINITY_DN12802_c0_g1_i1.p1 TRINITY_DN12802_c0_g1~~TRINITY_DN12802_c0_g1_i1.p1  ORF type:complete len:151 (+),score=32.90 TRINITY_DN12802_c0_g1_i1:518-970(+)
MVKDLSLIQILIPTLEGLMKRNRKRETFDECEELLETFLGIFEILSTKRICYPALNDDKLVNLLSKILKNSEDIHVIATTSISLANIQTENNSCKIVNDYVLIGAIISHMIRHQFSHEAASLCTLLNEIVKKLNPSHCMSLKVLSDHWKN